jgi:hypothetical protein
MGTPPPPEAEDTMSIQALHLTRRHDSFLGVRALLKSPGK